MIKRTQIEELAKKMSEGPAADSIHAVIQFTGKDTDFVNKHFAETFDREYEYGKKSVYAYLESSDSEGMTLVSHHDDHSIRIEGLENISMQLDDHGSRSDKKRRMYIQNEEKKLFFAVPYNKLGSDNFPQRIDFSHRDGSINRTEKDRGNIYILLVQDSPEEISEAVAYERQIARISEQTHTTVETLFVPARGIWGPSYDIYEKHGICRWEKSYPLYGVKLSETVNMYFQKAYTHFGEISIIQFNLQDEVPSSHFKHIKDVANESRKKENKKNKSYTLETVKHKHIEFPTEMLGESWKELRRSLKHAK